MAEELQSEIENTVKEIFAFLLERGFSYEYTYEKGSDSSCVYIHRFRKGISRLDVREVSGGDEINVMAYANGEYAVPNIYARHRKETRAFKRKHFFKKATRLERFYLVAELLEKECEKGNLFGIRL